MKNLIYVLMFLVSASLYVGCDSNENKGTDTTTEAPAATEQVEEQAVVEQPEAAPVVEEAPAPEAEVPATEAPVEEAAPATP